MGWKNGVGELMLKVTPNADIKKTSSSLARDCKREKRAMKVREFRIERER